MSWHSLTQQGLAEHHRGKTKTALCKSQRDPEALLLWQLFLASIEGDLEIHRTGNHAYTSLHHLQPRAHLAGAQSSALILCPFLFPLNTTVIILPEVPCSGLTGTEYGHICGPVCGGLTLMQQGRNGKPSGTESCGRKLRQHM